MYFAVVSDEKPAETDNSANLAPAMARAASPTITGLTKTMITAKGLRSDTMKAFNRAHPGSGSSDGEHAVVTLVDPDPSLHNYANSAKHGAKNAELSYMTNEF